MSPIAHLWLQAIRQSAFPAEKRERLKANLWLQAIRQSAFPAKKREMLKANLWLQAIRQSAFPAEKGERLWGFFTAFPFPCQNADFPVKFFFLSIQEIRLSGNPSCKREGFGVFFRVPFPCRKAGLPVFLQPYLIGKVKTLSPHPPPPFPLPPPPPQSA